MKTIVGRMDDMLIPRESDRTTAEGGSPDDRSENQTIAKDVIV
jgi:hypothetical protein